MSFKKTVHLTAVSRLLVKGQIQYCVKALRKPGEVLLNSSQARPAANNFFYLK